MSLTIAQAVRSINDNPSQATWVWRVQLQGLSEIPIVSFGTFNSGDSYMVLHTFKGPDGTKRKVYMWQGSASSQDEVAASAIFAKELDDALGGSPQQVHIVQNEEPDEFKQLFPNGLNFRHGGVASSLRQASAQGKAAAKLFVVKSPGPGKAAQVTEVRLAASSLVSNASFVLDDDLSNTLYVWHGGAAGLREKTKALDTANTFRSNRGQLRLTVLDQDDVSSGDALAFFALLGTNDPAAAVATITTCEGAVPKGAELSGTTNGASDARLFKVGSGSAIAPPSRTVLDPSQQFLLVSGGRAWLWVGAKSGAPQLQAAQNQARSQGVAGTVEVVKDRLEPGLFMTCFPDWSKAEYAAFQAYQAAHAPVAGFGASGLPTSPTSPPIDYSAIAAKMIQDGDAAVAGAGPGAKQNAVVVPPGSKITVSVVIGHEFVVVSGAEVGHFFAGDAYMVLHEWVTNTGEQRQVLYFWQGRHATNIEQGTAALLATDLHNTKYKGTSALVRVAQQAEPPHLVALFGGRMVVHRGERPASGLPSGGADVQGPRLYQVKCDGSQAAHAVEIELSAASLNSGDTFLLKGSDGSVTLWQGSVSTADEVQLAAAAATQLGASPTAVKEGSEPSGFWDQLGGRKDYPKTSTRAGIKPPVLYRIRDAGRAGLSVDASVVFSQEDLDSLDISILEDADTLMLWNGREAAPTERLRAHQLVEAYIKARGRKINIVDVEDGAEPPFYTQHFAGWDATKRSTIVNQFAKLKPVSSTATP